MRNKLFALLLCLPMLFSCGSTAFAENARDHYTVAQVQDIGDGIVAYKERQSGAANVQELIDGYLCDNAGISAEFYAIAISQTGAYRWSGYERSLLAYLGSHDVPSAASRLKYALALCAVSSSDSYISDAANEAIGGLGVMSLVFGLHLLNNGCGSSMYSLDGLIGELLSCQKADGGWAVMGSYGDADVTAMTVQALAPHYYSRQDVRSAVDKALRLLSERQLNSGGFMTMGAENSESAAQVVIALSALGIDAQTDPRFIKNGNTPLSAMLSYRCSDGSFAHTTASNENATMQAFCALTAYLRMCRGQSSLYLLDRSGIADPEPARQGDNGNAGQRGSDHQNRQNNGASYGDDRADETPESGGENSMPNHAGGSANSSAGRDKTYIAATNAAGEPVTVAVEENVTEQAQSPSYGGFQPSATGDEKYLATADEGGGKGGYKLYAVLGVLAASGAACLILFLLKKRGKKHYIAVGLLAAAGVIFILLTDFQSPEAYRRTAQTDGDLTVTLSIRCDTITGREKVNRYIPDDGVILDAAEITLTDGDSVYDALLSAVKEHGIPMDNRGAQGAAYIAGLNYLYEFDYGELSGWMYRVNGVFPDVGCQSCYVRDGDKIEWLYTTDIGKDLE